MTFSWKLFAAVLVFMLALDFVWLSFVANRFYIEQFGPIGRVVDGKFQVLYWAGAVVYLVMAAGLVFFALPRVGESWLEAALVGAAYGFLVYAVYDFTNLATLKHWPLVLLAVDVGWGTTLGALSTLAAKALRDQLSL